MADTLFKNKRLDPYRRTAQKFLPGAGLTVQEGSLRRDEELQRYRPPGIGDSIGQPVPFRTGGRSPIEDSFGQPVPYRIGAPSPIQESIGQPVPFRTGPPFPAYAGPMPFRSADPVVRPDEATRPGVPGTEAPILPVQEDGPLAPAARLLAQALQGSYGVNPRMIGALQSGRLPQLNTWGQGWASRLSPMLMQSLMGLYQSGSYRPEEMAWTLGQMAPSAPRYSPQVSW